VFDRRVRTIYPVTHTTAHTSPHIQAICAKYMYDLCAVVIHVGKGTGRGHYHAYIRDVLNEVCVCVYVCMCFSGIYMRLSNVSLYMFHINMCVGVCVFGCVCVTG